MASMFEKCPPEIISAICKIIADDDEQKTLTEDETKFKSLRSCSQACGTLRTHCLQHIFHNVDIRDSYIPQDRTAEIFTELVSGAPEIADCVRVLRYGMRFHDDLHYAGVLSFLNKLTGLRSLTLSVHGSQRDWTGIPPSTQSSILKLIHLPTLVSLDLRLIEKLDINVLNLCPNLRGLHLHAVTFYDRRVPRPDEKEFLSVVTVDSIRTGQPVVDFPRLNSLSFWILKKEEVLWEEFILSSSPQLESLKITWQNFLVAKSGATAIQESGLKLSSLKYLSFTVYPIYGIYQDESEEPDHPLPGICEALSHIASKRNRLETIDIEVILYGDMFTMGDQWGDLQRTLMATEWPSLRRVQLDIVCYYRGGWAVENLMRLCEAQFSLLLHHALFKFDFSVSNP